MAHKFLSIIVYQVVQSQLIEISHNAELQNIHAHAATPLPSYSVVHEESGVAGSFLNARTEFHIQAPLACQELQEIELGDTTIS